MPILTAVTQVLRVREYHKVMDVKPTQTAADDRRPPYRAPEVAALFDCSIRHVYRMAAENKLDHFRVGGMVRFYREPIDALLAGEAR